VLSSRVNVRKLIHLNVIVSSNKHTWLSECQQLCHHLTHGELCSFHVHPTNLVEELVQETAPIETREELVFVDNGPLTEHYT